MVSLSGERWSLIEVTLLNRVKIPLVVSIVLALLMVTIAFGIRAIAMGRMPIPTHYLLLTLAITFVIGTAILNQEEDLNTIVGGGIFAVIVSFIVLSLIGGVISIFEDPPSFNLLLSAVSVCIIVSAIMLRVFTGFTSA